MSELRAMALASTPEALGLRASEYEHRPWAVLMETGTRDGATYSLVVLADGTASLYFSTGGGIIGAGEHESVRAAGTAMLSVAERIQGEMRAIAVTPLPKPKSVQFLVLTSQGILSYFAGEERLGEGKDPLSELFFAAHSVITQMRLIEEKEGAKP